MKELISVEEIKNGWAAIGKGWAVHGATKEEAEDAFKRAVEKRREIDGRPDPQSGQGNYA